jgi:hypothetical protein
MQTEFLTHDLCETVLSFLPAAHLAFCSEKAPPLNPTFFLCEEDREQMLSIMKCNTMSWSEKIEMYVDLAQNQPIPLIHNLHLEVTEFIYHNASQLARLIRHAKYLKIITVKNANHHLYEFIRDACVSLEKMVIVKPWTISYPFLFSGSILEYAEFDIKDHSLTITKKTDDVGNKVTSLHQTNYGMDQMEFSHKEMWALHNEFNDDVLANILISDFAGFGVNTKHHKNRQKWFDPYVVLCEQTHWFHFDYATWKKLATELHLQPLYRIILEKIQHSKRMNPRGHYLYRFGWRNFECKLTYQSFNHYLSVNDCNVLFRLNQDGVDLSALESSLWENDNFIRHKDAYFLICVANGTPPTLHIAHDKLKKWIEENKNPKKIGDLLFACATRSMKFFYLNSILDDTDINVLVALLTWRPDILKNKPEQWVESFASLKRVWTLFVEHCLKNNKIAALNHILCLSTDVVRPFIKCIASEQFVLCENQKTKEWLMQHILTEDKQIKDPSHKRKLETRSGPSKKQKMISD